MWVWMWMSQPRMKLAFLPQPCPYKVSSKKKKKSDTKPLLVPKKDRKGKRSLPTQQQGDKESYICTHPTLTESLKPYQMQGSSKSASGNDSAIMNSHSTDKATY